ncbi:hypothetical protein T4B_1255 [Trichinella pseudospiralis]|uniref:Uncharacterized protein n=1 Tax=Trichinella pseudospiralis TaxID=6337 RepID=A0A0V1J7A9_TRIPS|nr:hypothetical protein T4B_1255 [Trichinella pseudospiralis]
MLLATAFLPLNDLSNAVELGRNFTGLVAASLVREEWISSNRLPLWNIKNNKYEEVQLRITALTAENDGALKIKQRTLGSAKRGLFCPQQKPRSQSRISYSFDQLKSLRPVDPQA